MDKNKLNELANELVACYGYYWRLNNQKIAAASKLGIIALSSIVLGPIGTVVATHDAIKADDTLDEEKKRQYERKMSDSIAKIISISQSIYPDYDVKNAVQLALKQVYTLFGKDCIYNEDVNSTYCSNGKGGKVSVSEAYNKVRSLVNLYLNTINREDVQKAKLR